MELPAAIASTIEAGGVVVASSARAARELRRLHAERQRGRGLEVWPSPQIVDWAGWLDDLWRVELRAGRESRLLLTALQEHHLWVETVRPAIEGRRLISTAGVADLAQQAYALLADYLSLDFLEGGGRGGADVESFREWARSFEHQCQAKGWLSRSSLPAVLRHAVLAQSQPPVASIITAGFDRLTPAQESLLSAFTERGCSIQEWEPAQEPGQRPPLPAWLPAQLSGALVVGADATDEAAACALWARRLLRRSTGSGFRIAVITPDAAPFRGELERIFQEILAPETIPIGAPDAPPAFEFSLGRPLAELPMIRAALLLLRWMEDSIPQEEITWLLLSGFLWGQKEELLAQAEFDALRRRGSVLPPEQPLPRFLARRWPAEGPAAQLGDRLRRARNIWLAAAGNMGSNRRSFAEWVSESAAILSASGWPGPYSLESEQFQARVRWDDLLDGIAALDFAGGAAPFSQFRELLEREARRTIFAAESHGAPVQILGPFEAAGIPFDAVWFLGADDARWPLPARPHPFLTRSLQKQRNMPHADADADSELAARVTRRLENSAPLCVFSYPAQNADGLCRPSTLVTRDAAGRERRRISCLETRALLGESSPALERERAREPLLLEQETAAWIPWPPDREAGGHDTLKMQSACPFRAFAIKRLHAEELEREEWGLDPAERGKALHEVLQSLWSELGDLDGLKAAQGNGSLRTRIEAAVRASLDAYRPHAAHSEFDSPAHSWSRAYLRAETERIAELVEEWLEFEAKRYFFRAEKLEEKLAAQVGALRLRLRADRVDIVCNAGGESGRILIDYKTGDVNAGAWDGERPDDPQMPLYAAYGNVEDLRGVLRATVQAGKVKFTGRVAEKFAPHPNAAKLEQKPYDAAMQQQWRQTLLALAERFLRGEAQVDPKDYPGTCQHCPLPGLCRVAELSLTPREREEDSEERE